MQMQTHIQIQTPIRKLFHSNFVYLCVPPELVANMKVRFGEFELIALAWFAGVCQKLRDRPRPLRAYAPRHLYAYGKLGAGADGKAGKAKTGDGNRRRST